MTATVYIEHDMIALGPTLRRLDGVTIEVISQGTTNPGGKFFPFVIEYPDRTDLEAALDADPTVKAFRRIEWTDGTGLYRIEHTPETKLISTIVADVDGFLAHTETKGTGWLVRLLLPDRSAMNEIWEYATSEGISIDVIEMYGNRDADGTTSYGLTDQQETALLVAFQEGYFDEPRGASLEEIAAELDLSSTAISGRLRRGMRNLVSATIAEELVVE